MEIKKIRSFLLDGSKKKVSFALALRIIFMKKCLLDGMENCFLFLCPRQGFEKHEYSVYVFVSVSAKKIFAFSFSYPFSQNFFFCVFVFVGWRYHNCITPVWCNYFDIPWAGQIPFNFFQFIKQRKPARFFCVILHYLLILDFQIFCYRKEKFF